MEFYEIIITAPPASRDAIMNRLMGIGASGFAEHDESISAYFEAHDNIHDICTDLESFRGALCDAGLPADFTFRYEVLEDRDWNEVWKKNIVPVSAGNNIRVIPPWEREVPGCLNIIIDSGMAFGTGHHETTRTCLALVEKYSGAGGGGSFLDLGTGTGILAIAAAKCGFQKVTGVDNDPLAVTAALKNVSANGLMNVDIIEGDITDIRGSFDVIIANLIARTLKEIVGEILLRLERTGIVVLSGMLAGEEEMVVNAYESSGLEMKEKIQDNGWLTLVLGRPAR